MIIAAFDLGSHMACARQDPYTDVLCFHQDFVGPRAWRAKGTMQFVRDALTYGPLKIDTVVYERPFCRGMAATRALWGIAGIIEAVATDCGCAVVDATPNEVKKFATGYGVAEKWSMIAAAQILGYAGENEHEADAFCLLKYAERYITKGEVPCKRSGSRKLKASPNGR